MNPFKLIAGAIIAFVVIVLAFMSMTTVGATEVAVVTTFGKVNGTLSSGLHFINPFSEIHTFDTQTQKESVDAKSASKDLQEVSTSVSLNYSINAQNIVGLYLAVGDSLSTRIIDPSLQESIKAATAKYTAEELITKRAVVTEEILNNVKAGVEERLPGAHLTVGAIAITNFDFSPSFNAAIEKKVTAEQDALAAKNKLAQAEYEKAQRIAQAQGEAEAIRIQATAINSQGGADYVNLKKIEKWNGAGCTSYCGMEASTGLLLTGK